jgi:hypothetical protein
MKTARFTLVVKKCGLPEIYLAWVDPKKDKVLKRALAENRVMTLHQELHGGKKDFGTVGYMKDRHAQILIFPKSLRRFADRRVIAVDYSLFSKEEDTTGTLRLTEKPREASGSSRKTPAGTVETSSSKDTSAVKRTASKRPSPAKRPKAAPARSASQILAEVKRAVAELAAGKSVPAYERLQHMLDSQS